MSNLLKRILGKEHFPLHHIPLQSMVRRAETGQYKTKPVKVFSFNDLAEAHELMESNLAYGKIVVIV